MTDVRVGEKKGISHKRQFCFQEQKKGFFVDEKKLCLRFQRHQFAVHFFDLLFASGATVYSVDIFLISTLGCCALNNKVNFYNDNSILLCFLYLFNVGKLFICL